MVVVISLSWPAVQVSTVMVSMTTRNSGQILIGKNGGRERGREERKERKERRREEQQIQDEGSKTGRQQQSTAPTSWLEESRVFLLRGVLLGAVTLYGSTLAWGEGGRRPY